MAQNSSPPKKLDRLYQQRMQLEAKIKAIESRSRIQARKDDTRRKIIVGALVLEHAEQHPSFADFLNGLIDRFVARPQDRSLFGLPALPEIKQDNEPTESGSQTNTGNGN